VGEEMQVTISNNIKVQNPTPELIEWCKTNLTIDNPDYAKKVRMGFWVGNTPKKLYLYEEHGDAWILPYGTLKEISSMLQGSVVKSDFVEPEQIDYGEPISLYPYQETAVKIAKSGLYGILQSKAGSGKTQMGIALVKQYGRKALWLVHTIDLLNQSRDRALQYMDKDLIGTITAGKVNIGKGVTFATVQTLSKLDITQYRDMWDVIIVDECHRVCGSPTQLSMFSKVQNSLSARHKYGLSATVHRADGMIRATKALIGDIVYSVPDDAIADRVMQVGISPIGTGVNLSRECLNTDGTLNYTKLINYLCENPTRNNLIRDYIVAESDKSCLILSDRLGHLETLLNLLPPKLKDKAVMISGKMTTKKGKAEREQAIEDMRIGKKKYLFATYNLCKEGLDIPRLERLFLTTNQKDYAVITQSIGRIARTYDGKANPIAYDFVDDIGYLVKSYKKRCTTYKKNNCYFVEEQQ
jgi:superfamily II DNA or RNA helicase